MGDDIAGLIGHLGLGQADLLGYSLGGGASLRCAIQHQPLVRRLALVSAPMRRSAWFPEVRAGFDHMTNANLFEQFRHSPMYAGWSQVAPDPDGFPALIDKTGELLRQPYDWSDEVKGAIARHTRGLCRMIGEYFPRLLAQTVPDHALTRPLTLRGMKR